MNTVYEKAKTVVGIKIRTANTDGRAEKDIPALWEKFFAENIFEQIPNKISGALYSIYTEYEGDFTKPYSYILGCEVSPLKTIPKGLVKVLIPPSNYAVFPTQGPFPQSVVQEWQKIWEAPLDRLYTVDYEVYPDDFDPQGQPQVKIYIAIH